MFLRKSGKVSKSGFVAKVDLNLNNNGYQHLIFASLSDRIYIYRYFGHFEIYYFITVFACSDGSASQKAQKDLGSYF